MSQQPLLMAKNLSKSFTSYKKASGLIGSLASIFKREYQQKTAVDSFSLEVGAGEIIGFLGPNGAGKTTLMKMFTGIVVPSSGELMVLGDDPWKRSKDFRKKNRSSNGAEISAVVGYSGHGQF